MALTPEETLRLAGLRAARDRLIKGESVAKVTSGGRSVDYAQADLGRLEGEIDALAQRDGGRRKRGAITFAFRS